VLRVYLLRVPIASWVAVSASAAVKPAAISRFFTKFATTETPVSSAAEPCNPSMVFARAGTASTTASLIRLARALNEEFVG
jgi:hypothetical protein